MQLKLALREWSGVIDALGQGLQTVMVRKYVPRQSTFFLYPTFSYYSSCSHKPSYFQAKFQSRYHQLAELAGKHTAARATNSLVDLQYYVQFDDALAVPNRRCWSELAPFFIWSAEHVNEYATSATLLWLVRVYKLDEPVVIHRRQGGGPPAFYTHSEYIPIEGAVPVISDQEFDVISQSIRKIIANTI